MDGTATGKAPVHLWIVGILSLLWNCVGAYDYVMSHTGGLAYFESMGLDAEAYAWFQGYPAWATAAWAIGVWVSLAGSLLLLFRSRLAEPAFLVSFLGAVISYAYQMTSDAPASMQGGMAMIAPLVIMILIVAQWYYARRMRQAGVLR